MTANIHETDTQTNIANAAGSIFRLVGYVDISVDHAIPDQVSAGAGWTWFATDCAG